jgi:hypothetical protein
MRWPIAACLAILLACARPLTLPGQQAESAAVNAEQVARAIDRGIDFLVRQQKPSGEWSRNGAHPGGVTALCTLALLNAGVDPRETVIQRALKRLDSIEIERSSVYSVSLMIMVYCLAQPDNVNRIREGVDYLAEAQHTGNRDWAGGWSYGNMGRRPDASNSQLALLALHEASLLGIKVDQRVWQQSRWYWDEVRHRLGGYCYTTTNRTITGSMTCAGISSLIIIDENLPRQVPFKDGKILCCVEDERLPDVEAASAWLAANFSVRYNPSLGATTFSRSNFYFLYGLERAARLSGQRFFGEHDWYREGAEYLVRAQRGSSWKGTSTHGEDRPEIATAFALLFLSKGRRPIVVGKYKHSDDNDWDRHRKGVHFLTRALESDWGLKLNWQTIEGRYATADDLLEAPVLFISGRDALKLGPRQKEALRQYVDFGGFVFAEACQGDGCGENVPFERDFLELVEELFPENRLQLLDASHPVYSAQYTLDVNPDRPLYGLQSSCRTSLIYCPRNLSGLWRINRPSFMEQLPERARNDVRYATQLGVNVVSYATGRELKEKLDRPKAIALADQGQGQRVVLIPKLAHDGGADDAPNAWQNIMRRARYDLKQRFRVKREMVQPQLDQLARHPMVFMHGRQAFRWSDEERQALTNWLENGGFLFADSICAAEPFIRSFRDEMQRMFPDQPLQPIPANDRIWSDRNGGYRLDAVTMHEPDRSGVPRRYQTAPRMEGIRLGDRWVVVFSPHDLSCAMENASANQCTGYDKDDAARLGVNIILYALQP